MKLCFEESILGKQVIFRFYVKFYVWFSLSLGVKLIMCCRSIYVDLSVLETLNIFCSFRCLCKR